MALVRARSELAGADSGAIATLYRAGTDQPCVTAALSAGGAMIFKDDQQLSYLTHDDSVNLFCPDGSVVHASAEQLITYNICHGINCPE